MPTIVMTACHRPEYTKTVLAHLAKCYGIKRYELAIFVEPVNDEVIDIVKNFPIECNRWVHVNEQQLGCNLNTYQALNYGFTKDEYVIALEDDTVPARDALEFFEFANTAYCKQIDVMTVCGYKRTPENLDFSDYFSVDTFEWFTPWGWASWRNRWEIMQTAWFDAHAQARASWDVCLTELVRKPRGWKEVTPRLARIQNIGAENGVHCPGAEWHKANQFNPFWAESVGWLDGYFQRKDAQEE